METQIVQALHSHLEDFTNTTIKANRDYDKFKENFIQEFDKLKSQPCDYEFKTEADKIFIILKKGTRADNVPLLIHAMSLPFTEGSDADDTRDSLVKYMIKQCPYLILQPRQDEYEGLTALHLAILQDKKNKKFNYSITNIMLKEIENEKERLGDDKNRMELSLRGKIAKGKKFDNTRMYAGSFLGVAALSGNKTVLKKLIERYKLDIMEKNKNGDNIFHSLIRHSWRNSDEIHKRKQQEMIQYVLKVADRFSEDLLLEKNKESLTPLQLAAEREEYGIFDCLMNCRVYRQVDVNDGLIDLSEYDITEIETITVADKEDTKLKPEEKTNTKNTNANKERHESILKFIGNTHSLASSHRFVGCPPVRRIINKKWIIYRIPFYIWAIWHMLSIAFIMSGGYYRQLSDRNGTEFSPKLPFSGFWVGFGATLQFMNGLIYVLLFTYKIIKVVYGLWVDDLQTSDFKSEFNKISHPYSNAQFSVLFPIYGLCLLLDFILAVENVKSYENVLLPFAMVIGCYLFLYFLQVWSAFSLFTVLIQKVVPDLLRFIFVMTILLVGFSMAMFMVMQGADTDDDSFDHYGTSFMTLLQVMLGIGEINSIFSARKPVAAIILFVLFVVLTTILLLNALIAIMSNTCSTVTLSNQEFNNKEHHVLQRLSVILQFETYLPKKRVVFVGQTKQKGYGKRQFLQHDTEAEELQESRKTRLPKKPKTGIRPRINPGFSDVKLSVSKERFPEHKNEQLEAMEIITFHKSLEESMENDAT